MTRVTEFPGPRTRRVGLRAAALAGVTVAAAAAVSGCGTGQVSQTAFMAPAVAGVNQSFTVIGPDDQQAGSISLRNMLVSYNGPQGYKKGGDAPMQVGIFNDTPATLKVTITAPGAAESVTFKAGGPTEGTTPLPQPSTTEAAPSPSATVPATVSKPPTATATATALPNLSASASPAATPSEQPAPPSGPATFTIPSGQFLMLAPQFGKFLVLQGLTSAVTPGQTVSSVGFQFQLDGGLQVVPQPASPVAGASPVVASCTFNATTALCRAPLATPQSPQVRQVPSPAGMHD